MNESPMRLILIFAVIFAVLVGIQVYFFQNTYELKRKEVFEQVRKKLNSLDDDVDIFDDNLLRNKDAMNAYRQLEDQSISEEKLRTLYLEKAVKVTPLLTRYVDSVFAPLGYEVGIRKEISNLYSHNLKKQLIKHPFLVYKTVQPVSKKHELSSGKWETSYSQRNEDDADKLNIKVTNEKYSFYVTRHTYFDVNNIRWILFKGTLLLVISSILILGAVLFLFYRTYLNLLKQRKQVEVLHDMMDNISHELKTPIATLKIAAKTLEKATSPTTVQVIGRQVDRLENMLQPMMHREDQKASIPWSHQQAATFLSDFQMTNPGVKIHLEDIFGYDWKVDRYDMETILTNLLNNSVKYGAQAITVTFEDHQGVLKIQVKDDGMGIDKGEQPYIFEKYYRIQKNNVHDTKGLGLGLYIVKQIAEKYKGQVTVSSELAKGAIFNVTLSTISK
jgi:two-component system phosphate regulon sensor histidine kinase PhoR